MTDTAETERLRKSLEVETQLGHMRKSVGTAYCLWFLLAPFAVHNFYAGRKRLA